MGKLKFRYTCTLVPRSKLKELQYIIDHGTFITYRTFRKHVDTEWFDGWCMGKGYEKGVLHIKNDYHVSYHRSKLPDGRRCYYFCWSAIEHVFY